MTLPTPYLDKWFPKHREHERSSTLELLISDLWRQFPAWPSTFSACAHDDCDNRARGGALCPDCLTGALAELVGVDLAVDFVGTVCDCVASRTALYAAARLPEKGRTTP